MPRQHPSCTRVPAAGASRRVATAYTGQAAEHLVDRPPASLNRKVWCVHGRRSPCSRFSGAAYPLDVRRSSRGPDRACDRRASRRDRSGSARRDERPSRRSDWVRPVAGRDGRRDGSVRRSIGWFDALAIDSVSSFSRSRSARS